MKYSENDIELLVKKIKEFKAGAINKAMNKHIDQCLEEIKEKVAKKKWWGIF